MNQLSKDQVKHLASLARLNLTSNEVDFYQKELTTIIGFIDQLKSVEVDDLPATEQVSQLTNVLRSDEIKPELNLDLKDCQKNHPNMINRHFKVPKVN